MKLCLTTYRLHVHVWDIAVMMVIEYMYAPVWSKLIIEIRIFYYLLGSTALCCTVCMYVYICVSVCVCVCMCICFVHI